MPHQSAVTIRAGIRPGMTRPLLSLLAEIQGKRGTSEHLPFHSLPGVHFARLFVLDADQPRPLVRPSLVYMAEVDGSARSHLKDLVETAGPGLDRVFGHCVHYPDGAGDADRLGWLRAHRLDAAATYVHSVGRSVVQVRDESRLRDSLEDMLDEPGSGVASMTAGQVHAWLRAAMAERPDLSWAVQPPKRPGLSFRAREAAHRVLVPGAVLVFLPALAGALPVWLVLLRLAERRDVPETQRPDPAHVAELEASEDFGAQNAFTAVGEVKTGLLRRVTLSAALRAVDYAARHVYTKDNLAGVRTIHFARWVPLDGGRRLVFASNYDGSLESYMDDFIDRVAWGLNAVFSNGLGYPPTRWLLFGGAKYEQLFKNYLRNHQVPTQVWYSAYDTLTARNIDTNAAIRTGLTRDLDEAEAERWAVQL